MDIRDIIEGSPPAAIAIRWPAGAIERWPERGKSPAAAAGRTPSRCGTISAPNIGRPTSPCGARNKLIPKSEGSALAPRGGAAAVRPSSARRAGPVGGAGARFTPERVKGAAAISGGSCRGGSIRGRSAAAIVRSSRPASALASNAGESFASGKRAAAALGWGEAGAAGGVAAERWGVHWREEFCAAAAAPSSAKAGTEPGCMAHVSSASAASRRIPFATFMDTSPRAPAVDGT